MKKSGRAEVPKPYAVMREYRDCVLTGQRIALYKAEDIDGSDEDESVGNCIGLSENGAAAVRMPGRNADAEQKIAQFRKLYRAADESCMMAVIPAIVLPSEVEQVREWAKAARESLQKDALPIGKLRVGMSIETPSAAILADMLAPMVDFFVLDSSSLMHSLGVAENGSVPESVRRCVKMTCSAASREGIEVYAEVR